jgi:Zn-dependent M28 family amino/carboxypeptidase
VFVTCSCFGQKVGIELVGKADIMNRLERGSVAANQRQAAIRSLFADVGCTIVEQPINKSSANVICTLPGETKSTIVVGAHFDFAELGSGIVDDWTGAALLASLYQALKNQPRQHTYIFAAFAGNERAPGGALNIRSQTDEQRGRLGSKQYVGNLTDEQKDVTHGYVNIECLGLGPVKFRLDQSSPLLMARLVEVAKVTGIAARPSNIMLTGRDDAYSFKLADIPVISIHSVTPKTLQIPGSIRDNARAIASDDYYRAYELTAFYLAYLDSRLD